MRYFYGLAYTLRLVLTNTPHCKLICDICGWRGGSQVDRKTTERVYAGGKDTERVEDGPDSADMEEERGCA